MILSVSRRTDVPACFSDWFFRRIQDGQACVRNPVNPHQVSRISLSPEVVDCIVFWSKNPRPMLNRLKELESYPYYFQFTLNTYGKDMEPFLPSLKERIQNLSQAGRLHWKRAGTLALRPDLHHQNLFCFMAHKSIFCPGPGAVFQYGNLHHQLS